MRLGLANNQTQAHILLNHDFESSLNNFEKM